MPESKAYELPDREEYPHLYEHDSSIYFAKGSRRFCNDIENYCRQNMSKEDSDKMRGFFTFSIEELEAGDLIRKLGFYTATNRTREVEFVLALQGKKIAKHDVLNHSLKRESPLWKTAESSNKETALITAAEILHDSGNPLTKTDLIGNSFFETGKEGRLIAKAAENGNLDQIKTIIEMNGEKLTKQDLMTPITSIESPAYENKSILFTALRTNQFDVVEQVLTDEGATISANEFLDDFNEMKNQVSIDPQIGDCLGKLLASSVFKDSTKNIKEMWKKLPKEFKASTENQKGYQIAFGKANYNDVKNVNKLLNNAGIVALKAKTKEQR